MPKPEYGEIRKLNARHKAEWMEQTLLDQGLKHTAFRVGAFIAWRFDKNNGLTIVSRETIAQKLGMTDRTVDAANKQLEKRGHVAIKRGNGRGLANVYKLILKSAANLQPHHNDEEAATRFSSSERAKSELGKGESPHGKGRSGFRLLSLYSQEISQGDRHSSDQQYLGTPLASKETVSETRPRFPFKNRGRYQRDLANRLPGNGASNMQRLSNLPEERLQYWCRLQRNAPDRVDLAELQAELVELELGRGSINAQL